ncbi:hypothetical protein [Qipengyuania sphaerica]|uniref:hypothetical protein n=1 Tax=Qipengyuania sphaerica TaxID=2867243 RepID=UPI001C86ED3D|nr:hypothetical protein [Qipengyuania sphaerica]MBX7541720.1 hypothetical protein [Qipengyuania sphaerica]
MSVRFAAARRAARSPIAKILSRAEIGPVANDHDRSEGTGIMSENTESALRHFAEHGLRAVPVALDNATLAATASHEEDYRYWLGICRELDAGAAARFEAARRPAEDRLIG